MNMKKHTSDAKHASKHHPFKLEEQLDVLNDEVESHTYGSLLWQNPLVGVAAFFGIAVVTTFLIVDYLTVRVNHIRADDVSQSAYQNVNQRKKHCLASSRSLKQGDSQIQIAFADRPEIVDEHKIDGLLGFGNCSSSLISTTSIGRQPGTSLILLLDYILTLIRSSRDKGNLNPFVVTVTLSAAEPGPGQPLLDAKGFSKVRSLVKSILNEKATIAIIGPSGALQGALNESLGGNQNLDICASNNVNQCVDQGFEQARKLGKTAKKDSFLRGDKQNGK